MKTLICAITAIYCAVFANKLSAEEDIPTVTLTDVRQIEHNGEHNAFTDLIWFKGRIYLAFRSCPDGHMVHPTSRIIILQSTDGTQWKPVHSFNVPDRDTRDPHFVDFNGRLFVYSGTWYGGDLRPKIRNMNQMLGYGVSTSDGERWSMPFQLNGTYGHYVWRGATYNNAVYLCARRRTGFKELPDLTNHAAIVQSRILRSDDGISFTDVGHFQTQNGDETAFHFTENGVIQAIARRGNRSAELIILKPPYNTPIRTDLGRYIGGPLLFKYQDYMLVAGRNRSEGKVHTNISILKEEKLIDLINLPSGGDCSYPGMVTLCPGCLLVSWYSSHLKDDDGKAKTCIFTAKLHIN